MKEEPNKCHLCHLLINHCRQLSATSVRASEVTGSDQKLSRQLREKSHTSFLDSQTLRIRKISLDNRCVCVCVCVCVRVCVRACVRVCVFVFMTVSALCYSFSTDGCSSFGKKTSLYTCSVTMYIYYSTELQLFMFA